MFDPGARVKVLHSSINGGKTGPKAGSFGYAIDSGLHNIPHYETRAEVTFCLEKVIFTRFGNEKKERCESKKVINVLPVPLLTGRTSVEKHITLFMNKPFGKELIDSVRSNFGQKNIPIVFMVPCPPKPCHVLSNKNEFSAWVTAVCRSSTAQIAVANFMNNLKIAATKCNINSYTIHLIEEMMKDKEFMSKKISESGYDDRERFMKDFNKLVAITNQKSAGTLPQDFMNLFANQANLSIGGNFQRVSAFNLMAFVIFKNAFPTIHKFLIKRKIESIVKLSIAFFQLKASILTNKSALEK